MTSSLGPVCPTAGGLATCAVDICLLGEVVTDAVEERDECVQLPGREHLAEPLVGLVGVFRYPVEMGLAISGEFDQVRPAVGGKWHPAQQPVGGQPVEVVR